MAETDTGSEMDSFMEGHYDGEEGYESSSYGSYQSSIITGAFSMEEYFYENGRRYHARYGMDKNFHPTDELEQNRMDIHHEIMLELLSGELYKAPLKAPRTILDIGTGTGIWAIDMADKFPDAEVIGIDLSPIQPTWVPPNCRFELDDAEKEWTWPRNSFDFIHLRNLAQSIMDWPRLLSQAYSATKPGGHVELAEMGGVIHCDDGSMRSDNGALRFYETLSMALERSGRVPYMLGSMMVRHLEEAGFVDVHLTKVKTPLGPWPRDAKLRRIGKMSVLGCVTGFSAYGLAAFTRLLGMSKEQAERSCEEAFNSITDRSQHTYCFFYVAHGKKPEGSGEKEAARMDLDG